MKYPGCWDSRTWLVFENGSCDISVKYVLGETVKTNTAISGQKLSLLKDLRYAEWEQERPEACDGTAWIITAYENGDLVQTTGDQPRYIYGLEKLQEIESLLPKAPQKLSM